MPTLETLLTSRAGFGLQTATPVQRAICRASDGLPLGVLWEDPDVRAAFGDACPTPGEAPFWVCILAAIRCAKSEMAAAKAIQMSQTVDLNVPWISAGDEIRIPIVSLDKDKARAVYSHVLGNLQSKPSLRKLLAGEPTAESIWVKHPTGRRIEITVSAMSKAGGTLVSRWLAGCIFDEAPRMAGDSDSRHGLEQNLVAVQGRILPGCQVWLIGSPWAPEGPVYEMVQQHFGKPSRDCVVIRGRGPTMNPHYWTPERIAKLKNSTNVVARIAYTTDVLGDFTDPEEGIFASAAVDKHTRASSDPVPPTPLNHYAAAMDPATRGNAWTLVIGTCTGRHPTTAAPRYSVVFAKQWIGTAERPLQPDLVFKEIGETCAQYRIDMATTDQHSFDALQNIAERHGLMLRSEPITSKNRLELVERAEVLLSDDCLELPKDPVFRSDLLAVKRRVTINGITLVLPKTGDGRHCDYVPALGLLMLYPPELPDEPEQPIDRDFERALQAVANDRGGNSFERAIMRIGGR